MSEHTLLSVKHLDVSFRASDDSLIPVISDVNMDVRRAEVVGLVGESGSGKTVTSLAVMGLLDELARVSGTVRLGETDLGDLKQREWEAIRGDRIAMIFQDPIGSLNPVYHVGKQVEEALENRNTLSQAERTQKVLELFARVGITHPSARYKAFPHALSGGMSQRVAIAMALAGNPELLIADEPTTALDVTIQAQILELLLSLRDDLGLSILLITHDLGVVAEYCDFVYVMYAGKIIEKASVGELFTAPAHPYTRGLLASIPSVQTAGKPLKPIGGSVPNLREIPPGCPFYPRCSERMSVCREVMPGDTPIGESHSAACHRISSPSPHGFGLSKKMEKGKDVPQE